MDTQNPFSPSNFSDSLKIPEDQVVIKTYSEEELKSVYDVAPVWSKEDFDRYILERSRNVL